MIYKKLALDSNTLTNTEAKCAQRKRYVRATLKRGIRFQLQLIKVSTVFAF